VVAAARRVGLTPTGWCAAIAAAAATDQTGLPASDRAADLGDPDREVLARTQMDLAELRTAVVRVGTNLNQAVAALNATGVAPVWLAHAVQRCVRVLAVVEQAATRVHRRLT
jgi:hypothetical protein